MHLFHFRCLVLNQRFIQKTLKDQVGYKNRKIFGADIFVPITVNRDWRRYFFTYQGVRRGAREHGSSM